jgi:hypothetical protein
VFCSRAGSSFSEPGPATLGFGSASRTLQVVTTTRHCPARPHMLLPRWRFQQRQPEKNVAGLLEAPGVTRILACSPQLLHQLQALLAMGFSVGTGAEPLARTSRPLSIICLFRPYTRKKDAFPNKTTSREGLSPPRILLSPEGTSRAPRKIQTQGADWDQLLNQLPEEFKTVPSLSCLENRLVEQGRG